MAEAANKSSDKAQSGSLDRDPRSAQGLATEGRGTFADLRALQEQAGNRAVGFALGRGMPLPPDVRADMEARFGENFDAVRIHDDAQARQGADVLEADAYTSGNHIFFDVNRFAPHSIGGRQLLVHELAHVVQQSRGGTLQPRIDGTGPLEAEAHAASDAVSRGQSVQVTQAAGPGISASPRDKWEALKTLVSDPDAALEKARELKDAVVDAPGKLYDKAEAGYDKASDAVHQAAYNFDAGAAEELSDYVNAGPTLITKGLDKLVESAADSETFAQPTKNLRNTVGPVITAFRDANRDVMRETLVGKGFQAGVDSGVDKVDSAVQGLFRRYEQNDYSSEKPPEAAKPDAPMSAAGQNYLDDPGRAFREAQVGVAQGLWKLLPGTVRMVNHPVATVRSLGEMPSIADPTGILRATGNTTGFAWDTLSGEKTFDEASAELNEKSRPSVSREFDKTAALVKGLTHEWVKAYEEGRPIAATTHAATDIAMFVLPFLKGGQAGATADALNAMGKADTATNATRVATTADAMGTATNVVRSADEVGGLGKALGELDDLAKGANEMAGGGGKAGPLRGVPAGVFDDAIGLLDDIENNLKVSFGKKKMDQLAKGGDVALDRPMRPHIDEPLPVGEAGIKPQRAVDRALDKFNRQFLDPATNSVAKHLGLDVNDIARGRKPLEPVSLADPGVKPSVIFERRFGEIAELGKVFDDAVAKIENLGNYKPTRIKAKVNKHMIDMIREGATPEAAAVRDALRSIGYEYVPGKGLTAVKPPPPVGPVSSATEAADLGAQGQKFRIDTGQPKVRIAAEHDKALMEAEAVAEQAQALAESARLKKMRVEP